MRTAKMEIGGVIYPLCFSARVVRNCAERYGAIENIDDALSSEDSAKAMDEAFWILSQMMQAGARYAEHEGERHPAPLSEDDLFDLCDIADFSNLKGKIAETITSGSKSNIEVKPAKNAEATPGGV